MSMITLKYVEPRTRTPADKIFEDLYRVSVNNLMSRTIDDLEENGMIVSGLAEIDRAVAMSDVIKWMTINDMVELYRRDVEVGFTKPSDTKEVYDVIQVHLSRWANHVRVGMNVSAPIEDLILLDSFANSVYEYAKYFFTPESVVSVFGEEMYSENILTIEGLFSRRVASVGGSRFGVDYVDTPSTRLNETGRESFSEHFKQHSRTTRW